MSYNYIFQSNRILWSLTSLANLNKVLVLFFLSLLLGLSWVVYGQTTGSFEVSLPSASAATLGEFNHQEIDLAQGAPSYRIPLFEASSKSLSVPIVLNYYSTGGKVEQPYNWIGVDWSIAAGGAIRRVVKGLPDESAYGYFSTKRYYEDLDAL